MAKIVWDETGKHYFEMGVDHGVLYTQKADGTYDAGVAWNGLTGVTESPDGAEPTDLWADNIKYATLRSAETFGGTIEAYTYPDAFMACDGTNIDVPGVRVGQQGRKPFGLCYRTKIGSDSDPSGDNAYLLHLIYNATASPSEKSYETINDSPDAITLSWEFTTNAVNVIGSATPNPYANMKPVSSIVIDSRQFAEGAAAARLAALEATLFGTDGISGTAPTLPTPGAVLDALNGEGVSLTYTFTAVSSTTGANPSVSGWYEATVAEPTLTNKAHFQLTTDTAPVEDKTYYTMVATSAS